MHTRQWVGGRAGGHARRGCRAFATLAAAALLTSCTLARPAAAAQPGQPDALALGPAGFSLLRDGTELRRVDTGQDIEALATDGRLVVWQLDDGSGTLHLRAASAADVPVTSLPAGVEADALCIAHVEGDDYDLFAADGDGRLLHFWLHTGTQPALRHVRTLATNPDVGACAVDDARVYFLNPPMGIAAYAREPETDAVMELVYAPAPAGAGTLVPAAFRLDAARGDGALLLWSDEGGSGTGTAWAVNLASPATATAVPASRTLLPLVPRARAMRDIADVAATAQTEPVPEDGDAADDPALLLGSAGKAWILGTNKRLGLHVYDLAGRELHRLERGRLNNVDAHRLPDGSYLVAASNRTHRTLDLFRADVEANRIEFALAVPLDLDDPYGLCMGQLPDGTIATFVGGTDGGHQVWAIDPATLAHRLLHAFRLESQTEGCVYDAPSRRLFVGEEAAGVWTFDVQGWTRRPFATTATLPLVPDVEGMDIYRRGDEAWLVVSSQGNDSFVLYSLATGQPKKVFRVGANRSAGIDGASETDGLAVTSEPLPGYPHGLLVVQDGRKRAPAGTQNFKVVDWRAVEALPDTGAAGR